MFGITEDKNRKVKKEIAIELINGNPVPVEKYVAITPKKIKDTMYTVLGEIIEHEGEKITRAEKIVRNLVGAAESGRPDAMNQVLDRTLGKPTQTNVNINDQITHEQLLEMLKLKEE